MDANRVKLLENYRKEDPNDPFTLYALALEYLSENPAQAKPLFLELLQNHPNYTATYYHATDCFYQLDDMELTRKTYINGIALLKGTEDTKALRELENAYQNFLFELED